MKRFFQSAVAALLFASMLTAKGWIVETPAEFISDGDFDGDGRLDVIVLDKETGAARVGFQNGSQELIWSEPFATGIANATGLTVGRISSTAYDSIAVAGPDANRINKLNPRDVLGGTGISPTAIFVPGVGPDTVSAIEIGGGGNTSVTDLFTTTSENPGSRYALLRNTGTSTSVISEDDLTRAIDSANVFEANLGKPLWLAGMFRAPKLALGLTDLFQAFDFSTGAMVTRLTTNSPVQGAEFVAHRFASGNPLAQVLFYDPGTTDLIKFQIQEANLAFSLGGSNRFRLNGRLQLVQPLPTTQGGRLLVFFGPDRANTTNASIYDFDGVTAPRLVQSYSGDFSGAVTLGNGNLAILNADGSGKSISHTFLVAAGGSYSIGQTASLPAIHRFSGAANAMLFDAELFVSPGARPRQLLRHADWSTGLILSPTVRVTGQDFLGTSNGLGGTSIRDFGSPISGVSTGLVNQYHAAISIFSGRDAVGAVNAEIRITPPGGHFGEAQRVSLAVIGSGLWQIYYRLGSSQNWTAYSAPITVISSAALEAYAKNLLNGTVTAIFRAEFSFNQSIGELDSDNDGVPDFVEQNRGLNPLGGPDSDGDGFTDLEELALGTDPRSAASKPLENAALRTAFNRLVTPRPPGASGTALRPFSNVPMRAYTLGGSFLALAPTSSTNGSGTTNPAAFFQNLVPEQGASFIVETTPQHFSVSALLSRTGRELIGLVPVPTTNTFEISYTFGNGSLATETAKWIAAASNAVQNAQNPTVAGLLLFENTLVAALFEAHAAKALGARGSNNMTHATLFDFRPGDSDRHVITSGDLRNLEQYSGPSAPGYLQQTVFNFLDGSVRTNPAYATLFNFTKELWRISAAENNDHEGVYALPYDELRRVMAGQNPSAPYMAFQSIKTNVAAARAQVVSLLNSIPPRPQTNLTLIVSSTPSSDGDVRLETSLGMLVKLWRFDGTPFVFPPNIELLPGARVRLFAHADLPAPSGEAAFEVISIALTGVPMPSPGDADGNLLVDSWEEVFFGGAGEDAFADWDGDGYSNLQEMLDGSQPDDALVTPPGPPMMIEPPSLVLDTEGAQLKFQFTWPISIAQRFETTLQASSSVEGPFTPISGPAWTVGPNGVHELRIPETSDPAQFYFLTLRLVK